MTHLIVRSLSDWCQLNDRRLETFFYGAGILHCHLSVSVVAPVYQCEQKKKVTEQPIFMSLLISLFYLQSSKNISRRAWIPIFPRPRFVLLTGFDLRKLSS